MKGWSIQKEVGVHMAAFFIFALVFVILHNVGQQAMLLFLLGGIIGTFLPDIDHLIYALFLRPREITSQRVRMKVRSRDYTGAAGLLFDTREEREGLIFHNVAFQTLFVVFAFLVVTSSGNILGRGLVLAFLISLLVDQYQNYRLRVQLDRWFTYLPIKVTSYQFRLYLVIQFFIILLLGFVF